MQSLNEFSVRVYYEDTDAGGIVYYANYFKYIERARTEFLRSLGLAQSRLLSHEDTAFVVRHIQAEFLRPAKLDDCLTIHTQLTDIGGASLRMQQQVKNESKVLFMSQVRLGVIDASGRPKRLSLPIKQLLAPFL